LPLTPHPSASSTRPQGATITYPYALACQRGINDLPATCTCQDSYTITFTGGGTYNNQRGCTAFEESGRTGMCVVTCTGNRSANKKPYACSCGS
ncbi:hypothetical protein TSOC_006164, partial [Tetrabaena socialis]